MESTHFEISSNKLSRVQKFLSFFTVIIPLFFTVFLFLNFKEYSQYLIMDILLFLLFYFFSSMGISIGYHRYFTHRSFKANRFTKILLAIAGGFAMQGPVLYWATSHRRHHAYSDTEKDLHSPIENGAVNFKSMWHSHIGWLFTSKVTNPVRFSKDLMEDKDLIIINRYYLFIVLLGIFLPSVIAYIIYGNIHAMIEALLWGGILRMFLLHHMSWSLNSFGHVFGTKQFSTKDQSRNIGFLSAISVGESWHNNHHAFPRSAKFGLDRGQFDPAYSVITLLNKVGFIWDVVVPTNEQLNKRRI